MFEPWFQPWSNSSTAPPILKFQYVEEKALFAGSLIGTTLYGTPADKFAYSRSLQLFGLSY